MSDPRIAPLLHTLRQVYKGRAEVTELLITALLAGGHVLLEDLPGVGKTTLARALARAIHGNFRRIQGTPDMMPADITGLSIYDESHKEFVFHPGPVFCDVLVADELNRMPPRTQSALLEALSESQVTIEGEQKALSPVFFCIATQNQHDQVGTYPLPDSQCDRFMLRYSLGYPGSDDEFALLRSDGAEQTLADVTPCLSPTDLADMQTEVRAITLSDDIRRYILQIVQATRSSAHIEIGASPRAALGLQRACQARAWLQQRSFVVPDDVQALSIHSLAHRIRVRSDQEETSVLRALIDSLAVPR